MPPEAPPPTTLPRAAPRSRRFDFEGLVLSLEHAAPVTVLATPEAGVVPFVLSAARHRVRRPLVVVVPDAARQSQLLEALAAFEPELWPGLDAVVPFEPSDSSPFEDAAPVRSVVMGRVAAGYRLNLGLGLAAVVLPAEALLWKTLGPALLDRGTVLVSVGSNLDPLEVIEDLAATGYDKVPVVEDPGTFALTGAGLDVWSPLYPRPVRIRIERDDVKALQFFDPDTQATGDGGFLVDFIAAPVREVRLDALSVAEAAGRLTQLADRLDVGNLQLGAVLDELHAFHAVPGMEGLLPGLSAERATLLELAPTTGYGAPLVVLDGPDACFAALDRAWAAHVERHRVARAARRFCYAPEELFAPPDAVRTQLARHTCLWVRPFALHEERALPTFQLDVASNREVAQELRDAKAKDEGLRPLVARVHQARKLGEMVVFAAHSEGGRQRLQAILRHYGVATEAQDGPLRPADVEVLRHRKDLDALLVLGGSGEGYSIEALHLLVVDEDEVFGHKTVRPERRRQRAAGQLIRDMAELHEGDYVVHIDHGVARYVGLQRLAVAGAEQDFLLLLYKDDQRLYVPVTSLDRVQKFVSGDIDDSGTQKPPTLDRLGSERWLRAKKRARKAVAEVADELVKLYAERQARPGHAFSPPDEVFREWEASFPWEETPDQQRAIDEVLFDLQTARPADRLVCGDVGYGKTEVAIRAAAKVALDGRQVAVLVPTTILCEQHRLTFQQRCKGLPLRIESLSRFKDAGEQKVVLEGIQAGALDIVIGTHRLLSKDVVWKDLGLLVIDEEHRFGVGHKEAIKKWKSTIDCLTLSATPIPRTLQMATLGLRDLSLIATPPENRKSVRTVVCRGTDEVLKEGIERELARGGQIFYVCNRIGRLDPLAAHLTQLVPGVKPIVAHGQMPEQELEDAMLRFMRHDVNVLVCTTIIESGLDIPNANTMFVERADTFGLAQLYQLRGRVGRSSVRAYCYLTVPERERMTQDGARRVAVLERFTELGSGVQIATHDLEIRGAGNLLGQEQTGHIAEIGYELYIKLLEEAVNTLRGTDLGAPVDPEIKTTVTAYLPERYVPDAGQRLQAYKRLAGVRDDDELDATVRALADRYGPLPAPASALVAAIELRVLALKLGLAKVEQGPMMAAFTLHEHGALQPAALLPLVNRPGGSVWRLSPEMVLARAFTPREQDAPVAAVRAMLQELVKAARGATHAVVDVGGAGDGDRAGAGVEGSAQPERQLALPGLEPRRTGRLRVVSGR
ncbi:MAG: transcription-repair coupling factor [Myxococcales bacterium]|nr:transcription-repair coupling factor [Myxococcales bacterium]